jgi:predicted dehydrogenase
MRVLLVGHGYWGKIWERTISRSAHHNVVGIVDPAGDPPAALGAVNWATVDVVVVATPVDAHSEVALVCAAHRKPTLIENPATRSLAGVRGLIEAFGGTPAGVGYVLVYSEGINAIANEVDGTRPHVVHFERCGDQGRHDCGVKPALLCHDLATACWLFGGDDAEVLHVAECTDDRVRCTVRVGKCTCHFYCSWEASGARRSLVSLFTADGVALMYDDIPRRLTRRHSGESEPTITTYATLPLDAELEALAAGTLKADLRLAEQVHVLLAQIADPRQTV